MASPIDDLAFLARSETRVRVLRAIHERPRDRRDIADATDTPRSTLGRTLGELEDQGWIRRDGQDYEVTTAGSLVVEQLVPLLDTVGVLQTLGAAIERFPIEETELDVQHLADARFVTPTEMDPTAPFRHGVDRLRDADRYRAVVRTAPRPYVEAIHDGVTNGDLTVECVLDGSCLDEIRNDAELLDQFHDVASESTTKVSAETIPYGLIVLDDVVHLWLCDEDGEWLGLLESRDPRVVSWANETVDEHLDRGRPLDSVVSSP